MEKMKPIIRILIPLRERWLQFHTRPPTILRLGFGLVRTFTSHPADWEGGVILGLTIEIDNNKDWSMELL